MRGRATGRTPNFDGDTSRLIATLRAEARAYEHGEGVPRDSVRAVELYCEAARLGDAEAQFSLGWMYANGRGVPRDNRMASLFFGIAAAQGHEYAQKMLAFVGPSAADLPDCMRDPTPPADRGRRGRLPKPTTSSSRRRPSRRRRPRSCASSRPSTGSARSSRSPIIRAESNFDPNARSTKNAQGLMQLIPETSARFNVKKPFDPVQNVRGGLAYLRWLLAYFRGDVTLVAAAYNAGERHGRTLPRRSALCGNARLRAADQAPFPEGRASLRCHGHRSVARIVAHSRRDGAHRPLSVIRRRSPRPAVARGMPRGGVLLAFLVAAAVARRARRSARGDASA